MIGVWRVPRTLDSSARQARDLADVAVTYELELRLADSEPEVTEWVDREELLRPWPRHYLPHDRPRQRLPSRPQAPDSASSLDPFHADVARNALAATQRYG